MPASKAQLRTLREQSLQRGADENLGRRIREACGPVDAATIAALQDAAGLLYSSELETSYSVLQMLVDVLKAEEGCDAAD